jgi:dihydrofolate synthase / folylpolyglutamate synthase
MGPEYRRLLARLEQVRQLGVLLGLERLEAALQALGSPHRRLPAVHIAGSNGKGSTAAMVESILRQAGLRTGLYTSPHLSRFSERIQIAGREVDGELLGRLDRQLEATGVPLTYFEVATALGFMAMAEAQVQVAVLEVGLGGRLDATNVCQPLATAITSIGLEHTDVLGTTLAAIAREKAGIAKPDVPLYLGALPPEAEAAARQVAAAVRAPVGQVGVDLGPAPVAPALAGPHQQHNAALAVALARAAAESLGCELPEGAVERGLRQVVWPARLEQLAPDVLVDGAHNLDGLQALLAALPAVTPMCNRRPRVLVLSLVRGKPAAEMLALAARAFDGLVLTRSHNPRAVDPAELAALLPDGTPPPVIEADAIQALDRARAQAAPGGLVVVAGSLFLAGEIRAHLRGEPVDPIPGGDPMP